jgi:hypothetical protein
MPADNPLFVPLLLDVLLINEAVHKRDAFRRWKHDYNQLHTDRFDSSEPEVLDQISDKRDTGAVLHWTLPRALRASKPGSSTDYPLVPNRWLVVRLCRNDALGKEADMRTSKAWVVESDCPPAPGEKGTSHFLVDDQTVANWKKSNEPRRKAARPSPVTPLNLHNPSEVLPTAGTGAHTVNIGSASALAGWHEQAPANMFLKAVAPGNLEFSAYVPFHEGIFAHYDDLKDVPDTATLSYQVIGWYSDNTQDPVVASPPAGQSSSAAVLKALGWQVANQADPGLLTASLYAGTALQLKWERKGDAPADDQLQQLQDQDQADSPLAVAIANTSVDAFTRLVASQLTTVGDQQKPAQIMELLRAFHYDMLPLLNQVNGDALLQEKIRQEWFSSKSSGIQWVITADQAPGAATPDAAASVLTDSERSWLTTLNVKQQALNEALVSLHHLQWELHAAWWKAGVQQAFEVIEGKDSSKNLSETTFQEQAALLEATDSTSPLALVLAQLEKIHELSAQVPQPIPDKGHNAQAAFLEGVAAFAASKGLQSTQKLLSKKSKEEIAEKPLIGKVLKAMPLPRFWLPNNPTIVLSGVEPSAAADPDSSLTVRLAHQQVSEFVVAGTTVTGAKLTMPTLDNEQALPVGVGSLYREFFLLDPANAPFIAACAKLDSVEVTQVMKDHNPKNITGVLPAFGLNGWTQKWNPLYLEWEVLYTDVPYEYFDKGGKTQSNWRFNGTDYVLVDQPGAVASPSTLRGRSVLSAHTKLTFGDRLQAFAKQYGGTSSEGPAAQLSTLYDAISRVDSGWHFLSQELVHFNTQLTQRDARAFRRPTTEAFRYKSENLTLAKITGYPTTSTQPPYDTPPAVQGLVGAVPAAKMEGPSSLPFHHLRSGQAYLNRVTLYDKFGRLLELVMPTGGGPKNADSFGLEVDEALLATPKLKSLASFTCPFQLPPRILQPAKLALLPVDNTSKAGAQLPMLTQEINPVCGWLIANHLDQGLLLFAPDGTSLGELRLGPTNPIKEGPTPRQVQWQPPLHDATVDSVAAVAVRSPQLGAFVLAAQKREEADFRALLAAIDSTLWTTEPLGTSTDQHLSVLVGRPLALVRLRVEFALDGPPLTSCDWPAQARATAEAASLPPFADSRFSIRLGSLATREDGVIGYFTGEDYSVFNSVAAPELKRDYVQEIGPLGEAGGNYLALPFDGHTSQLITVLADPRAAIHATTGLFPVTAYAIPAPFVYPALARLELAFRVGPRLAHLQPTAATGEVPPPFPNAVSYLPLSEKKGAWSWWEKTLADPTWQGYGLTAATPQAAFGAGQVSVRDGYLQFVPKPEPQSETP